jgi:DNA-binding HxlR family transcriptional regulator
MKARAIWTTVILLLCFSGTHVFAELARPNSSPDSKTSKYGYDDDILSDACFFPKYKARWDGYNINNWNWFELTDEQRNIFISEGIAEIERIKDAVVTVENKWRLMNSVKTRVNDLISNYPNVKRPMIDVLLDSLKENGFIKFKK